MLKNCLVKSIYFIIIIFLPFSACKATETWEKIDKRIKSQIYELNVGVKIKLENNLSVQLIDLSPTNHYPVFATSNSDKGYRVVGFGTAFPLATTRTSQAYFFTNRHVVNSCLSVIHECERFYAGLALYAKTTANGKDFNTRYNEILEIVNYGFNKSLSNSQLKLYKDTVDGIWNCYDSFLTVKADPQQNLFRQYLKIKNLNAEVGYFIHPPGDINLKPYKGKLFKVNNDENTPDLAILTVDNASIPPLELDLTPVCEGQEIQVIGYPTASDQIDMDSSKYYAPTFSTGRISRVAPRILEVDAPVSTGNSGGPVVNIKGKVVGIVAVRAISAQGSELPNFAGAITNTCIHDFASELFQAHK